MDLFDAILSHFSYTIYLRFIPGKVSGRSFPLDNRPESTQSSDTLDPELVRRAFGNGRVLAADRNACEEVLSTLIKNFYGKRGYVKPVVIAHLAEPWDQVVTDAEIFYLCNLLERSGSRKTFVWIGRELTGDECLRRQFPQEGTLYSYINEEVVRRNVPTSATTPSSD
jgi:hypothetical protein